MLVRRAARFKASEITGEALYLNRRAFMATAAAAVLAGCDARRAEACKAAPLGAELPAKRNGALSLTEPPTKWEAATTYNNFYEFGVDKDDPCREAHRLRVRPWTVEVGGLVRKPRA